MGGGKAMVDRCTKDIACSASSPNAVQFGGAMNQCNADSQCLSFSPDIGYKPSFPFCCDDVQTFYSEFCSGGNASLLVAASGCAQRPNNCVGQPALPISTTPVPSCTSASLVSPVVLAPTPSSSSPSTTPAPSSFQVKISLTLAMPLAAFNSSVQRTFKEQMAVAAGLPKSDAAARVQIAFRAAARRRLRDGGSVAVDVTIGMPDSASAGRAVSSLSAGNINTLLSAAGLPAATITSPAAMSESALYSAGTAARPDLIAAVIGGLALVLSATPW